MRKFSYIATIALLATLAGCGKVNPVAAVEDDYTDAPWAVDYNTPVPIVFGDSNDDPFAVKTKAPITSMTGVQFGVFAADVSARDEWTEDDNDNESVLLVNRAAEGIIEGGINTAQFVEPGKAVTYYYPLKTVGSYNHTFFAYHTTETKVSADDPHPFQGQIATNGSGDNTYEVPVQLNTVDILWAKAEATTLISSDPAAANPRAGAVTGFNTKYARESRLRYGSEWRNYAPKLQFKHLTTAFHFWIELDPEDSEAASHLQDASGNPLVMIQNMRVSNVYTQGVLDVVDGTLEPEGDRSTIQVQLPNSNGIYPKDAPIECDKGLFLVIPEGSDYYPNLNFDIVMPRPSADEPYTFTTVSGYTLTPPSSSGKFELGKSYRFNIIVKSLEKIYIEVTLEDWEDGFTQADIDNGEDIIAEIG